MTIARLMFLAAISVLAPTFLSSSATAQDAPLPAGRLPADVRYELRIIGCPVLDGERRGRHDPRALEIRQRPQAQDIGRCAAHRFS